ncbi:unnamed protein product [Gongylonema pulchrum]|uniref:Ubiquitinyl hydrolase 1 n=1 Tax=Gongylonema pulchrum TaxID=637853 RepID=A0A183D2Z0_9BILA|nr:unnamed protein product [Gongylonema pulchrum]
MFDQNLVKIKLEENTGVSTAAELKNQEYLEVAVKSEDTVDIKKEIEEHSELGVNTEAYSDIEEQYPEHLKMKFEIDQDYTDMLNVSHYYSCRKPLFPWASCSCTVAV